MKEVTAPSSAKLTTREKTLANANNRRTAVTMEHKQPLNYACRLPCRGPLLGTRLPWPRGPADAPESLSNRRRLVLIEKEPQTLFKSMVDLIDKQRCRCLVLSFFKLAVLLHSRHLSRARRNGLLHCYSGYVSWVPCCFGQYK